MGAHVTLCGPPTLIPRDIEALGCDVRYTLDDLREADVVYALRMQHERMDQAFVPSLREYAARSTRSTAAASGPRQVLMHPGPVNRGVELSGEVVDSPQSVIIDQVEAGVVVRMAVLYEVLAGTRARRPSPAPEPQLGMSAMTVDPLVRAPAPPATLLVRGAHVLDPRTGHDAPQRRARPRRRHRRARGARARSRRPRSAEVVDGGGAPPAARPSSTRTCTCAPPGRSTRRTSRPARAPRPPAGSAAWSRCRTPTRWSTRAPVLRSLRDGAARDARVPVGFMAAITRGLQGRELTEMAELRDAGRARLHRRRPAGRRPPACCARRCSTSGCAGGVLALHEEDPSLSGAGAMHEGRVSARSGVAGIPSVSESTMVARDAELAGYEGGRDPPPAPLAAAPPSRRWRWPRRAGAA